MKPSHSHLFFTAPVVKVFANELGCVAVVASPGAASQPSPQQGSTGAAVVATSYTASLVTSSGTQTIATTTSPSLISSHNLITTVASPNTTTVYSKTQQTAAFPTPDATCAMSVGGSSSCCIAPTSSNPVRYQLNIYQPSVSLQTYHTMMSTPPSVVQATPTSLTVSGSGACIVFRMKTVEDNVSTLIRKRLYPQAIGISYKVDPELSRSVYRQVRALPRVRSSPPAFTHRSHALFLSASPFPPSFRDSMVTTFSRKSLPFLR